jgi:hypothetical protein
MLPIPLSPRLILAGIAATALLATAGGLYWKVMNDQYQRNKAAVAASQAAQRQAEVTTTALDEHSTHTVIIREREDAAVQIIQAAPGSDSPVPPLVLDAWRRGLLNDSGTADPDSPASVP